MSRIVLRIPKAAAAVTHSSHNLPEHLKARFHTRPIAELTDHSLADSRPVEYNQAAHWLEQYKLLEQLLWQHYMLWDLVALGTSHIQQPAPDNPAGRSDTARMLQQELLVGRRQTVAAHQVDHNLLGHPAVSNWQQLKQRAPDCNHPCLVQCHRKDTAGSNHQSGMDMSVEVAYFVHMKLGQSHLDKAQRAD